LVVLTGDDLFDELYGGGMELIEVGPMIGRSEIRVMVVDEHAKDVGPSNCARVSLRSDEERNFSNASVDGGEHVFVVNRASLHVEVLLNTDVVGTDSKLSYNGAEGGLRNERDGRHGACSW